MRYIHVFLAAVALFAHPVDAGELDWIPDVPDYVGDYRGRILDGITGQPLSGVVVVAQWEMLDTLPLPRITGRRSLFEVAETVSDDNGQFVIRDLGKDGPPPTWKRDPASYPRLWFYKAGYDYLALARGSWDSGREPVRGELLNPVELQSAHDPSKGKLIVLFPVGTQAAHLLAAQRAPTSPEVGAAAASYLASIVWTANGSQGNINEQQRATAEKLSRPISIVDADILRLSGKRHTWSSCMECAKVLRDMEHGPAYILQLESKPGRPAASGNKAGAP